MKRWVTRLDLLPQLAKRNQPEAVITRHRFVKLAERGLNNLIYLVMRWVSAHVAGSQACATGYADARARTQA
jgi:hypothetical protein